MGQLPPPYMGPTIATQVILGSKLKDEFEIIFLDMSDHRDLSRLNKVDLSNIVSAIKIYFAFCALILWHKPRLVYLPICQTTLGYLRDVPFILIAKLFKCRIICHLRGGNFRRWYLASMPLMRWVVNRVHSFVDAQIVLGENLRFLFEGIIPMERIFVVPNGANIEIGKESATVSYNKNKIIVLFLSNFLREKGLLDVMLTVRSIYKHTPDIEFIFAGEWVNKKVKREVGNFLKENPDLPVKIMIAVDHKIKRELLLSADIFTLPTFYPTEGHPWAIIEAMAAGLPIITTNQGAITESVQDGVNGFIVEKRNPGQIAEKIKFLVDFPNIRKKMGEASRKIYLEKFTEDKMVQRLSFVFNTILSR
ncbi:MAG: glycosyltransferase family 4 protein [Candidatus Jordarchaeum sp.]|uniref:glycosyltransferase family 4 protein n=1 Tax=Candidatus Jordarchaeum sp. TaxID=2823881 RepID=UPI00404A3283